MPVQPSVSSLASSFNPFWWLRRKAPAPAPAAGIVSRRVSPGDIGKGFADPRYAAGVKRIVVTVDAALFARVRDVATSDEISMAAAVRKLIECGLDARSPQPRS